MALPDCFKPKLGPEIALDIAIHHAHLSPVQKEALQLAFGMDVEMHALADIISGWPNDIPTGNTMSHSLLRMDLCSVEKPSSSLWQKGEGPWYSALITSRHYQNTVACP